MTEMRDSSDEPAIQIRSLSKRFGHFPAVDSLTLSVGRGSIYGLLGPNGAGKTTVVRVLCGLARASSGEARLLGVRVPDARLLPRIGYMPQDVALYPDLSVRQNLGLFAEVHGLQKAERARAEEELLALVGLSRWRDAALSRLSGGMKRRVSLVCAMVHSPELLLLDEPTVGVDPELRASFWKHFDGLSRKGVTVLITTHYMDEAGHCDRVGLMREGRLIAEGAPSAITASAGAATLEEAFLALARHGAEGGAR